MEEKVIELVKKHQILYNKAHQQYKRLDLKEDVWKSIAKDMKLTVDEVKRRWKSLRDSFFRHRRTMCTVSGSAAKSPGRKWKYFDQMLFLVDIPAINTCTSGNFSRKVIEETSAGAFYGNFSEDLEISSDGCLLFDETFENPSNAIRQEPVPSQTPSSIEKDADAPFIVRQLPSLASRASTPSGNNAARPPPGTRRKARVRDDLLFESTHKEMSNLIKTVKQSFETINPVSSFFNSMAVLVSNNNLSFERFSALQVKVMKSVHEEIKNKKEENKKNIVII